MNGFARTKQRSHWRRLGASFFFFGGGEECFLPTPSLPPKKSKIWGDGGGLTVFWN